MKNLIDKLHQEQILSAEEFRTLLTERSEETDLYARELADQVRQQVYGNQIYVRGLIEFTNYCKNDCYYCGIRRSNRNAQRYRLTEEDILACCKEGYELGFRTFVLQGGEDGYYTDEKLIALIRKIKEMYPDCALTFSIGEKSEESYRAYKEAGADRYLLRHETAMRSTLSETSSGGNVLRKPQKLSSHPQKTGLSDRCRLYGGFSLPDHR